MTWLHNLIVLAAVAAAIYYAYLMYTSYKEISAEPGEWDKWERLWAVGKGSATKFWARIVGLASTAVYGVASLASFAGLPEVQTWINANVSGQTALLVFAGIAIVTEIARNRTA